MNIVLSSPQLSFALLCSFEGSLQYHLTKIVPICPRLAFPCPFLDAIPRNRARQVSVPEIALRLKDFHDPPESLSILVKERWAPVASRRGEPLALRLEGER